ncbi:MAG: ribosome biogenesis GTPase Der [Pseudomonadota bacterium]
MALKIAIVGRPNVGKSTLFNRLAGKRLALVDDQPGVTRDRKQARGRLADLNLILIDTAGFEDVTDASLEARMRAQTEAAIADAEVAVFLFDAREGVTPVDERFAEVLRKAGLPVVLAGNKAEGRAGEDGLVEGWGLGLGEPVGLSAEHGEGVSDLYDALVNTATEAGLDPYHGDEADERAAPSTDALLGRLAEIDIDDPSLSDEALEQRIAAAGADLDTASGDASDGSEDKPIRLAIVGRPNAGKSTLINTLLQSDRLLTGPEAGITRDSVSVDWVWSGRKIRLVDTAGLRKRAKVQERLERMSTGETIRSLKYADIVALVMDAGEALEKQDLQIADLALREGRGLVLVVSKWDRVKAPSEAAKALREKAARLLPNSGRAPIVFLSGLTGRHTEKLMPAVAALYDNWTAKVRTGDLNRWLRHTMERHPPPAVHGKPIKPKFIAQVKARPPSFVLMASRGNHMPEAYKRYLINGIREAFDLQGVLIRLYVRQPKNPYADKA